MRGRQIGDDVREEAVAWRPLANPHENIFGQGVEKVIIAPAYFLHCRSPLKRPTTDFKMERRAKQIEDVGKIQFT